MLAFTTKYNEKVKYHSKKIVCIFVEALDEAVQIANKGARKERFIQTPAGEFYLSWLGKYGIGLAFDMSNDEDRSMVPRITTTLEIVNTYIRQEAHYSLHYRGIEMLDYLDTSINRALTLDKISKFKEFKGTKLDLEKLLEKKRNSVKVLPGTQIKLNLKS